VGTLRFDFVAPEGLDETPEVRLMSESRFASQEVEEGANELPLSPGRYAFAVQAVGYDPVGRAAVEILPDQTTELGQIRLFPGTGTIQGYVTSAVPLEGIEVELTGLGRHPCHSCRVGATRDDAQSPEEELTSTSDCVVCGFGQERSLLTLHSGERFLFSNLSQGHYRIRAHHRDVSVPDERAIELAPGGHSVAALTIHSTTPLDVQLVASGELIQAGHASDLDTSVIRFRFKRVDSGEELGTARVGPRETKPELALSRQLVLQASAAHSFQISAAMDSELMILSSTRISRQFVFELYQNGPLGNTTDEQEGPEIIDPIDRPRTPDDSLYTATDPPEAKSQSFSAEWLGPRRVRIHELPRDLLMLEVESKHGVSSYSMVDLRFGDPPVYSAILIPQTEDGEDGEPDETVQKILLDLNHIDSKFIQLNPTTDGSVSGSISVPLRIDFDS